MAVDINAMAETAKALAEPARLAIEKLSGAIALVYQPTHLRQMAKAENDTAFIKAIGNQDVAALLQAAEHRETYRKVRQEVNLKLIADRVTHLFEDATIPPNALPPPDEWVDEFTDQSKDASSDELRELWAQLYVAETKQSGAVPRRILRKVRDLDAALAKNFTALLSFSITPDDGRILVLTFDGWLNGLDFTSRAVRELQDVDLIAVDTFGSPIGGGAYRLSQDRCFRLTFENDKKLSGGIINVTSAGIAIAAVAERRVNEQYVANLRAAAEKAGAKFEYPLMSTPRP